MSGVMSEGEYAVGCLENVLAANELEEQREEVVLSLGLGSELDQEQDQRFAAMHEALSNPKREETYTWSNMYVFAHKLKCMGDMRKLYATAHAGLTLTDREEATYPGSNLLKRSQALKSAKLGLQGEYGIPPRKLSCEEKVAEIARREAMLRDSNLVAEFAPPKRSKSGRVVIGAPDGELYVTQCRDAYNKLMTEGPANLRDLELSKATLYSRHVRDVKLPFKRILTKSENSATKYA